MGSGKSRIINRKSSKAKKRFLTLSDRDIDMFVRETHFSRSEIVKWHTDFLKDCPNGLLTERQFMNMYEQVGNREQASTVAKYLFQTFDLDGTGTIDFEEFIRAISAMTRGNFKQKLSMVFRLYDINNDGKLERHEMRHIIQTFFGDAMSSDRIDRVFELLDLNSDSVITKNEFLQACANNDEVRKLLDPTSESMSMEATNEVDF
ncbi:hypothetical protein ACOME3_006078 [Neoechinorhynchus agilis]